ncbi:hypothetical protein EVAR_14465_1 [Eumeta japonica]|uniref:Uncharacterized protein n=1 Tax=Eumeta variegata TaxID=151549 RepID=A0A4C1U399_EUMVA|nr:hypothetical protein EVAR_14465_1 [Eumeta japonica]
MVVGQRGSNLRLLRRRRRADQAAVTASDANRKTRYNCTRSPPNRHGSNGAPLAGNAAAHAVRARSTDGVEGTAFDNDT